MLPSPASRQRDIAAPSPSALRVGGDCTWPQEAGLRRPSCVLGEVGLSPAQIQLRTLVPFRPPFPLPGTRRLAAAAPSPWLPLLGYWWEAGHRADLANLHTEGEGRGRSQGPWGTGLFPSCPEPRGGPGPTWGSAGHRFPQPPLPSIWVQSSLLAPPKPFLLTAH